MAQRVSDNLTLFILAAGIGTRLGKLTENRPKALVEINKTPMINLLINKMLGYGFSNFVVNLHHHGKMLESHLLNNFPNLKISFSNEEKMLLDTGGALIKAKEFLRNNDPFLVHNVDIILPFNPCEMLVQHSSRKALMTLAVSQRKSKRKLIFNSENELCGWTNTETGELRKAENYTKNNKLLAYSGVQWVSTDYFEIEQRTGRFSIIDSWLDFCHKKPVIAYEHSKVGWFDLGNESKIQEAERFSKS